MFGNKKKIKSILVLRWDEIGDMVYSLHIFDHLSEAYPEIPVTVYCKPFVKPLISHHPVISSIIHELPDKKFDLVIELRGNWNTLSYALTHPPKLRFDRGTVRLKNKIKGRQKHETETNFEIIKPLLPEGVEIKKPVIYINDYAKKMVNMYLDKNDIGKFLIIHPVARKKLRQWPANRFAQLISEIHRKFKIEIVIVGTKEEKEVINSIEKMTNATVHKCVSEFNLLELAYLCERSELYIGNESGPLHIAAVMDTPLIGLYGPGVKDVFYPIGKSSHVLHNILDCNPCDQEKCVRPESPCIELIELAEVQTLAFELLND
ncbi:MAG: glycosyltransferase family 9 protein [Flavobacteriales bacterium]|nr:glycosyltransferase family 9 protein [Flavobacteriales bacterium]